MVLVQNRCQDVIVCNLLHWRPSLVETWVTLISSCSISIINIVKEFFKLNYIALQFSFLLLQSLGLLGLRLLSFLLCKSLLISLILTQVLPLFCSPSWSLLLPWELNTPFFVPSLYFGFTHYYCIFNIGLFLFIFMSASSA